MLHAPLPPNGGVPPAKPTRRLPIFRRRYLLPAFRPEHSVTIPGALGENEVPL